MNIRTKEGQEKHDRQVAATAASYVRNGWSAVYADLPGNARPPKIGEHIPDVYARHGGYEAVVEVETADSVNTDHARHQVATFTAWVRLSPTTRQFNQVLA